MNNSLLISEKTLRRLPPIFTMVLILLLGFPVLITFFFHPDFKNIAKDIDIDNTLNTLLLETQVRSYFKQVLLQWTGFSLAVITALFAYTKYRLTQDKVALVIAGALLFPGMIQAFDTLLINRFLNFSLPSEQFNAVLWTFSNTMSGLILTLGLWALLPKPSQKKRLTYALFQITMVFLLIGVMGGCYLFFTDSQHALFFNHAFITRPYECIDLITYGLLIFYIYPKTYKKYSSILTHSIFYMGITQMVLAVYLMFSPPFLYAANIVYSLKIMVYFIPFACLIINYIYSYNAILDAQQSVAHSKEKLAYFASHDDLTELYNRREFEQQLNRTIANAERENRMFGIFLIDIDNFKLINDTLGHPFGDQFLKKFAERLTAITRAGDVLSRIGGDEFTIVVPFLKSTIVAKKLAERLKIGLNTTYLVEKKPVTSTVSIGIALYPQDGKSSKELLKNADIAMYYAKHSGKNSYHFYSNLFKEQKEKLK